MADEVRGAMFDEFVSTGGFGEGEAIIKMARFNNWDYRGKVANPVLALRLDLVDVQGGDHEEQLSAGELRFFVPSSDGKKAVPVGAQQKLNIQTNAVAFLMSLMNADTRGQLAAKLKTSDDISILDGTRLYLISEAAPKRATIQATPGQEARQQTVLKVQKVLAYAWDAPGTVAPSAPVAAAAAPAAAPVAAAAPAAAPAAGGNDDLAAQTLLNVVANNGGSIPKTAIAGKVFSDPEVKKLAAPVKNAILALVVNDAFLSGPAVLAMGMVYANGTVSLG